MSLRMFLIAALLVAAGCGRSSSTGPPPPRRQVLQLGNVNGLSGMSLDTDGTIWMVPERDREFVGVAADGTVQRRAIHGVPMGTDLESVAFLAGKRFAFGTEPNVAANGTASAEPARVLIGELDAAGVSMKETIEFDLRRWDLRLRENEGVEGLCRAGVFLVVAIETVGTDERGRFAPIAVYDLGRKSWSAYRLRLTTDTGKISALVCRRRGAHIRVVAVERTFNVLRLLRFSVSNQAGDLRAHTLANLDRFAATTGLNVEGIELSAEGDLLMVIDNQWKGITGPNELLRIGPVDLD